MDQFRCEIINDIMPLYVEEMVSDATKKMVEEHIKECSDCRNKLLEMQKEFKIPMDNIVVPMASLKKKLGQKKLGIIILSVITVLTLVILALIYVTAPIPLEYDKSLISIEKLEDGRVLATISKEVEGYSIEGSPSDIYYIENSDRTDYEYHITLWNSLWNKYIIKGEERSFIINKNEDGFDDARSIYYYSGNIKAKGTNDGDDLLIYGEDMYKTGGTVTLPRLTLSYNFILALMIAIIGGVIRLLSKKRIKIRKIAEKITLLSVSYMIGHLCVKGFDSSSHYLIKDFSGILLLMIPIYCIMVVTGKLIHSIK